MQRTHGAVAIDAQLGARSTCLQILLFVRPFSLDGVPGMIIASGGKYLVVLTETTSHAIQHGANDCEVHVP